jgi:hypothetical protein
MPSYLEEVCMHKAHPVLRWSPSKLAEWLAENMQAELAIPAKQALRVIALQLQNSTVAR